jgi:hypothetical protein
VLKAGILWREAIATRQKRAIELKICLCANTAVNKSKSNRADYVYARRELMDETTRKELTQEFCISR